MGKSRVAKYEPNWNSLKKYNVPDWFTDAKFGIFIHWGVYSVPAFSSEWYPRHMYIKTSTEYAHHVKKWGQPGEFGYKDFIPMFKAQKWDPEAWIELFKKAGAKYVVPVAEHHDGFPMYDCSYTRWNAANMGPCRDVCAELGKATRKAGLKFGVSSHRAFNWHYYTFRDEFDNTNTANSKLYGVPHRDEQPVSYEFVLDWYARTQEMVDKFSPDILWFDFGWQRDEFGPWRPRVAAYYYNHALKHGYEPVLQYKDKFPDGVAVLDIERGKLADIRPHFWQTDTSVSYRSWSYIENDEFRTVASIVHDLVDIVSKNGSLLLNIGPRSDGTIPKEVQRLLLGTGEWLNVNGEAIYGARPWKVYGEGETGVPKLFDERAQKPYTAKDFRFTQKDGALYAICLGWPGKETCIRSLGSGSSIGKKIAKVTMLGSREKLAWTQDEGGLKLRTPAKRPCGHAYTFRIKLR